MVSGLRQGVAARYARRALTASVPLPCRPACGACCIAPSISPCAALPGGKPSGVRCPHLTDDVKCALFGLPERPATCVSLRPQQEMCGDSRDEAFATITRWELLTRPAR
jgi:hypothetical protein